MPAATKTKPILNGSNAETIPSESDIQTIRREETSKLAYEFWIQRGCPGGCPEGSAEEDWYRAERELALRRKPGSAPR